MTPNPPICECGEPGIKKIVGGGYWTCQRCIDLDAKVSAWHIKEQLDYSTPEDPERAFIKREQKKRSKQLANKL